MRSLKELLLGLWGIHLMDEDANHFSKPSQIRKFFGLILVLVMGPIFILGPIVVLIVFGVLLFTGQFLYALLSIFIGIFAIGLHSIPCWIFIDWEKNRLKDQISSLPDNR